MNLKGVLLLLSGIATCSGLVAPPLGDSDTAVEIRWAQMANDSSTAGTEGVTEKIGIHYGMAIQNTLVNATLEARRLFGAINSMLHSAPHRQARISMIDVRAAMTVTVLCNSSTGRPVQSSGTARSSTLTGNVTTVDVHTITHRDIPTNAGDRVALALGLLADNFKHAAQNQSTSAVTTSSLILGTSQPEPARIVTTHNAEDRPTITKTLHLSSMPLISESGICHFKDSKISTRCVQDAVVTVTRFTSTAITTTVTLSTARATATSGVGKSMENPIGRVILFLKHIFE
ncbi:hypothetical protein PVAG01_03780 [Phlyctema vagabunda]|uniref:Uncharacterized protein n=1 Tax=Phlyctema vagabunda TaxID=108571 RepID=A0ABR4PMG3_9HELO